MYVGEGAVSFALFLGDYSCEWCVFSVGVMSLDADALADDRLSELEEGGVIAGLPDEDLVLFEDLGLALVMLAYHHRTAWRRKARVFSPRSSCFRSTLKMMAFV